jgi:DNA repair protein RadC
VEAGMTVGIPVLDHIIIARGGHTSFREQGLIF